eukprot:5562194-Prymnesium_polylepis.1
MAHVCPHVRATVPLSSCGVQASPFELALRSSIDDGVDPSSLSPSQLEEVGAPLPLACHVATSLT